MATQKRRVIYMSDQQWEGLTKRSSETGLSVSEIIRTAIGVHMLDPLLEASLRTSISTYAAKQAKRDAILRALNKGK